MRRILTTLAAFAATWAASPVHAQVCTPFTDVLASSSFCTNIQWLFNRAITLGCTPSQYCPAQFVRRDQMAALLNRLGNIVYEQGGSAFGATGVLGTRDDQSLDIRVNDVRAMRYEPNAISPNLIGGSPANSAAPGVRGATIAGGGVPFGDTDPDFFSEKPNRVTDAYGTVGGGYANQAGDDAGTTFDRGFATVAGGQNNTANGHFGTIGGGAFNLASANYSTVGGGIGNTAGGPMATVAGGWNNTASGEFSVVPGGIANEAAARASVAMGYRAKVLASAQGSFVYSDSTEQDFASGVANEFIVGATGGIGMYTSKAYSTYCRIDAGGGTWSCSSSRDVKRDFAAVDSVAVLEKVVRLPLSSWRFVNEPSEVRHLGPVSQDFRAAFGLGSDDRSISTVDAQGVALAAIQGLNAKLEALIAERDSRVAEQAREIAKLRAQHAAEISELRQAIALVLAPDVPISAGAALR